MNTQPFSITRGQGKTQTISVELGGAPLNLATASAATLTIRPSEFSTAVLVTKSLGSGIAAGTLGYATITLTAGDTAAIDAIGSGFWSLAVELSGVPSFVAARGTVAITGPAQQFVKEGVDQVARDAAAAAQAASAPASHATDPAAHLNIVRRTLSANLVLTAADLPWQNVIPDADRDVVLPAEGATQWLFEIRHGGAAYVLTIKRAGGTTVASLVSGAPVVVAWDGVAFGMC